MREIDRRSKIDRRNFLKTAGAVPPAMAVAATTGLSIDGAWADNAQALKPDTMKTLAQLARDIYPHDHLTDRYYIAAVTPWDGLTPFAAATFMAWTGGATWPISIYLIVLALITIVATLAAPETAVRAARARLPNAIPHRIR